MNNEEIEKKIDYIKSNIETLNDLDEIYEEMKEITKILEGRK